MEFKSEVLQLVALRHSRGISLESISASTRVALYYLQAIEDCDFEKLPGGIYRDSFLRQYAQAIDGEFGEELGLKLQKAARDTIEAQINSNPPSGLARKGMDLLARGTTALILCNLPVSLSAAERVVTAAVRKDDPRLHLLRKFFEERNCPAAEWAADFIVAADRNGLDWRLVASIAFHESTGGKFMVKNNPLGWNSGRTGFRSTRHAVHYVADRLANAPVYAGKDLPTKLRIYNPELPGYPKMVLATMDDISPSRLVYARSVLRQPKPAVTPALQAKANPMQ